jgi:hypothetical protein
VAARILTAIDVESEGVCVARLDCGHRRHIRHRPPLEYNPWILDPEQRAARIGQKIECGRCDEPGPR